jgi:hypothetical protein
MRRRKRSRKGNKQRKIEGKKMKLNGRIGRKMRK